LIPALFSVITQTMNIYQERLMDHYHHPRNRGHLTAPDFSCNEHNPSCGDSVSIAGILDNDHIKELVFEGKGCVISQAVASMVTQACIGKTTAEVLDLKANFVLELAGITLGPTRLKCALLALQALHIAIRKAIDAR
jgi:nitrogen fixation protein NifU and related proteins